MRIPEPGVRGAGPLGPQEAGEAVEGLDIMWGHLPGKWRYVGHTYWT